MSKLIDNYRDMIDGASRPLAVFADSIKEQDSRLLKFILEGWTAEDIRKLASMTYEKNYSAEIREEIIRDDASDETILRRIKLIDFQLSLKALWQPDYHYKWNTRLFDMPPIRKDENGGLIDEDKEDWMTAYGRQMYDVLVDIKGRDETFRTMSALQYLASHLNCAIDNVEGKLDALYRFAGGKGDRLDFLNGRQDTDGGQFDIKVSQLFESLDDCKEFFKNGDKLKCSDWAVRAKKYMDDERLHLDYKGDTKTLYDEIHKRHPAIAGIDTFRHTLRKT